ncbi:MAG: hypothetical protein Q7T16_06335 [Candidatus Burarchaeum sp.]|nr:hypothetical protein [Candidatus Burarchaeum sp.]MDO8340246.1 hypothetical protein [Candidatus Burarchaeum sp.]
MRKNVQKQNSQQLVLAAAAILLVLALAYVSMQDSAGQSPPVKPPELNKTVEPPCFYSRSGHNVSCERLGLMLGPEKMNGSRGHDLSASLFAQLPEFPKDLHKAAVFVTLNYLNGSELAALGEEYWKQPEFYPGFWLSGVGLMQEPPQNRWGASGMRGYPVEHFVDASAGGAFVSANFFTTSWLVMNRQAVALEPHVVVEEGTNVSAEEAASYFNISIGPREFILGVAWPVFEENWAQKVVVDVKVSGNVKPGKYQIYFDVVPPSEEAAEKWAAEGLAYVSPSFMSGLDRPYYAIHVRVLE